ncbi:MAG TPA: hypothetical protein VKT73_02615 [Xanthobacteraceae bacterium]|nr:hypothetical protein [Xanthobacteraceae bacterium]
MRKTAIAILTGLALVAGINQASAGVAILAELSPDTISVGGIVNLDFQLTLTADPGDFGATLKGGHVTLLSGDGQSLNFSIAPPGGTTREFKWDVTYLLAGNYTPSYSGEVTYTESSTCSKKNCPPVNVNLPLSGNFADPLVGGNIATVNVSAAAPELSTWMMMLIGFAGVGFVAYRRARKLAVIPASA